MGRKIVVTSGKGGVGKTSVVAGLARALAKLNATVCVVDGDIGLNNLDLLMNVENKVVYDIVDCMQGKCRIKQALIKDSVLDSLYTLPSGKNWPINIVLSFDTIIDKLASIFDFVIVDSPAGIEDGFKRAVKNCTEAIVVVTPHLSSVRDANKTLSLLSSHENLVSKVLVINRIRGDLVASGDMMNHKDIEKLLNTKCIGVLAECDEYNLRSSFDFVNNSENLMNKSLTLIAHNIIDGTFKLIDYTSRYSGIIGYFRRKLKRI